MVKRLSAISAILIGVFSLSFASLVSIEAYPNVNGVTPGDEISLAVVVHIAGGWHINSHYAEDDMLIPTKLVLDENEHFKVKSVKYPTPIDADLPFYSTPLKVYEGDIIIYVTGIVDNKLDTDLTLSGTLSYQGCNDQICSPPEEVSFSLQIPLLSSESEKKYINSQYFDQTGDTEKQSKKSEIGNIISEKGLLLSLLIIFIGGLGLNLTPCVYPLIPITIGYFGGQAASKKGKKVLMAFLYVLGMATINSLLGTVAALTGSMFGSFLTNPIVLVVIALIMVTLALSMFGLYEIQPPASLMRLGANLGEGYFGALFMGLTMGVVAAPCIGPFVIGLLTYVATTGSPLLGFLMFFTLSMGLGIPFMILAFFSSKISSLPRSGRWMVGVRMFFGFLLLAMAIYFLNPLLGRTITRHVYSIYSLSVGVYLVLFNKTALESRVFTFIKNLIAVTLIFIAGWMLKPEEKSEKISWQNYNNEIYQESIREGKPVIIDFYADWCIPCKELEKITFSDKSVIEMSKNFTMLKVNLTFGEDSLKKSLKEKYNVKGVPTIIFITGKGNEIEELRLFGFEKPEDFLARMKKLLNK